jgi:hypothetical protein
MSSSNGHGRREVANPYEASTRSVLPGESIAERDIRRIDEEEARRVSDRIDEQLRVAILFVQAKDTYLTHFAGRKGADTQEKDTASGSQSPLTRTSRKRQIDFAETVPARLEHHRPRTTFMATRRVLQHHQCSPNDPRRARLRVLL